MEPASNRYLSLLTEVCSIKYKRNRNEWYSIRWSVIGGRISTSFFNTDNIRKGQILWLDCQGLISGIHDALLNSKCVAIRTRQEFRKESRAWLATSDQTTGMKTASGGINMPPEVVDVGDMRCVAVGIFQPVGRTHRFPRITATLDGKAYSKSSTGTGDRWQRVSWRTPLSQGPNFFLCFTTVKFHDFKVALSIFMVGNICSDVSKVLKSKQWLKPLLIGWVLKKPGSELGHASSFAVVLSLLAFHICNRFSKSQESSRRFWGWKLSRFTLLSHTGLPREKSGSC